MPFQSLKSYLLRTVFIYQCFYDSDINELNTCISGSFTNILSHMHKDNQIQDKH